ncbi:Succinate dehydrogenase cytochrome b small subunit, mitochondrial [Golovinomyces cichoracearum]|uniref:Succinate dehydrogenase [ubiquinone] cytochrome b small subunit n=1 Tax=Golovinomyces cichoracearum TaxID=62708 RepID=A0A420IDE1_9PEZI|nr:Succinate dehydrogenase cytochrome b small subunit, mitochondrial [Golovinomyces cichoracearum]
MAANLSSNLLRQLGFVPRRALTTSRLGATTLEPKYYSNICRNVPRKCFTNNKLSKSMRLATFHTSGSKLILPPIPPNDPAPIPSPEPSHGSYHWTFERLISAGLIPLTIAPFAAGSLHPTMDAILCGAILIHSHIGFEAVIIDYLPRNRVPKTRLFFWWMLRAATVAVGVGLYEFETNDVGVTEAISRIWKA